MTEKKILIRRFFRGIIYTIKFSCSVAKKMWVNVRSRNGAIEG